MEKLNKDEAIALMRSWADMLDVNDETDDFTAAIETLLPAVRSQRLAFDEDKEVFTLVLSAPLVLTNSKRESLEIKELTLDEKSCVEKYDDKEKIGMVTAIYAKSAGLSIAEASKIKGRDFSVITAINSVFFS
jgi:hypothetical protein